MKIALKYVSIVLGVLVLLVAAAGVAVTLLIDPNDFRDEIAALVESETGRRLTLDGEIDLTAFPCCSLQLGEASLSNPPRWSDSSSAGNFASVDSASLSLQLLPLLLSQELRVGNVELSGLVLNLHTRANGDVNWSFDSADQAAPEDDAEGAAAESGAFAIAGVAIREGEINYRDDTAGDDITLRGVNLTTGAVSAGEPFDLTATVAAEGLIEDRAIAFSMDADALFDAAFEQFALDNVRATFDDSTLTGNLRVTDIDSQALEFALQIDQLNLDSYIGEDPADEAEAGGTAATPTEIPAGAIRSLQLDGTLGVGSLILSGAQLSDVAMTIKARDGRLRLNPLKAVLYDGTYSGDVQLDVRGRRPQLSVNEQLTGISVADLLADMAETADVTGAANISLRATATSNTVEGLLEQLNGAANFDIQNGLYQGVDLWHEIRSARAKLKDTAAPAAPEKPQTELRKFAGTFNFKEGTVSNPDFTAEIPFMRLTGNGGFNLLDSSVDYRLQARVVETPTFSDGETLDNLTGLTLPVRVRGTIDKPKISVDLGELAKSTAKKKLKDRLRDKLGVDDESATTDETTLTEEQDPKDEAKDRLKNKLRGLLD